MPLPRRQHTSTTLQVAHRCILRSDVPEDEIFDLLIRDGAIVDGTGAEPFHADVAVEAGRIVAIGPGTEGATRRVVAAEGRVVAPGFIDMHSHSDLALVETGVLEMKLAQGVTLEVIGQDGLSCAPLSDGAEELVAELIGALNGDLPTPWGWRSVEEYLDRLDGNVAQNVAFLVPHGTVRASVLGATPRPATPSEIDAMRSLVEAGMRQGAFGLSTGLSYPPAHAATTEEIIALAEATRSMGGIYVTHLRSYGEALLEATEEALEIGRRARVPVHFSHFQAPGRMHHGSAAALLGRLEQGRAEGLDISFDVYPYEAASTMLSAFLPAPVRHLPAREAVAYLADGSSRRSVVAEIDRSTPAGMDLEWSDIRVANGLSHFGGDGTGLVEIAASRGKTIGECIVELLISTRGRASVVAASTLESDVETCITHPLATVGSDGLLLGERPHPRAYGTFPRFIRRARRSGLPIENAVTAMTGRSARRLGLTDRGRIAVGAWADLCVFDLDAFNDMATFDDPCRLAVGMDLVTVNGRPVWQDGEAVGDTPGRALRSKGVQAA